MLRARYAMSGTDIAVLACYARAMRCPVLTSAIVCCAMSGTSIGSAGASVPRPRYAMPGTDVGYAATRGRGRERK
eukprot:3113173-Rhodomonas_salina.1